MAGDLYLVLHIEGKRGIQRDGMHLYSKVNIDYTEAILGTVKRVDTVEGIKDLQISPGIQPGHKLKFPYMGVPNINKPSSRGDHYFTVQVQIPKNISDAERELVEKLASLRKNENNAHPVYDNVDQTPSGRSKNENHWLKSVKNFLRRKQSGERFSSICFDNSAFWYYRKPQQNWSHVIAVSTVLVSAVMAVFFSKYGCSKLLPQRKEIEHNPTIPAAGEYGYAIVFLIIL